jgi:hypothetical protein
MANKTITRRDFLKIAAVTPLAGAATPVFRQIGRTAPGDRVRVVLVRDRDALDPSGRHNPEIIQKMLDDAVSALFGEKDPAAAWRRIVNPSDTVGIKTNIWRYLPTGEVVEQALKRRVREAGVPEDRIGIADWGVLSNPLFQNATALINARPARTHHWAGMGGCIKNMIMFVPRASDYHADSCADLASIWSLPPVKGKTRLNVLLLLTPLFHGIGPHHFSREYVWPYRGILVGQDPVAVDATGVRILQARRLQFFKEDRPLQPPAHHIVYADTRHHLGVSDRDRIELVKLGWQDDILI